MSGKDDKKKLYEEIVANTDDAMLLDRMTDLGFWSYGDDIPDDPADEAKEWNELEYEIAKLRKKSAVVADPQKALAAERVRRWNESKTRRAKAKIERDIAKKERRQKWEDFKATRLVTAGHPEVSAGLEPNPKDAPKWLPGLPQIATPEALATALGLTIGRLRWLTFHRKTAALVHYHRFEIPKKTGAPRLISAPKKSLKQAQGWILREILERVPTEAPAHGFVKTKSVKTNALPHVKQRVVLNLDLQDFFPSLGFRRVKGLFHKGLGYPEPVAVVLALLCTEPPRVEAELDGKVFHVALGDRVLPQGAPTSPAITNLVCRRLDRRLGGLAKSLGFAYTRYADDLTFSGEHRGKVGRLLKAVRDIVPEEGFKIREDKTRVMHRGRRQEVTGVSVNHAVAVPRTERRLLRAILRNAKKSGSLASQNRAQHPKFREHLTGRIAWVAMVEPRHAVPLLEMLKTIPD